MAQITLNSSGVASNGSLLLQTNGTTTAVTIDTAGNMGLGVTPSAWASGYKAFDVSTAGSFTGTSSGAQIWSNTADTATGSRYKNTAAAGTYQISGATHAWFTAPSGTAGNAISFTQAMTLDASGNLLLGQTSATGARLTVTSGETLNTIFTTSRASGAFLQFQLGNGGTNLGYLGSAGQLVTGGLVNNFALRAEANMVFSIADTERARIDSSGNLLVGDTATVGSAKFFVTGSVNSHIVRFYNTNASPYGPFVQYTTATPNNTSNEFYQANDQSALRFSVRSNGGIANYSANDVNLSDRREKTNFAPASNYLAKICAIPVQTFNYADQNMEDDPGLTLGVVAQDVQAVAPELVMESDWGTEDEPKMRLSIYQTDLQYALMKCIQEQQAIIQTLTDRITALEQA